MDLIEVLNWRYAVKKYNGQKVSDDKLHRILKAIALSASSSGIQPYRVFVINDNRVRQELAKDSFNSQIKEAPHLIAFAAFNLITKEHIADFIRFMAKERGLPESHLEDYKNKLELHLLTRTNEENFIWSSQQAYIALGTGLIAAADAKVDATPMEGFNREKLDELLGLRKKGLKSVLLLALGYRDTEKDFLANQKKVRLPLNELVTEIN
ncbi:NAD(P)H-dependent oxidoreductase [Ulvibacterium sp.]|uniref:NAD(P)H-dependent oxidoreductase n=1 Tax=Ulvibacterium sp. TaxID=2665914 RepID=UPI003BAC2498